jgi:protein phosphatase
MSADGPLTVRWTSSSATRCGSSHAVNQDCFGDIGAAGLFVVADGVGGSADGEVASQAVVDLLDNVVPACEHLETRVQLAEDALNSVNAALWREGQGRAEPAVMATTVVALLLANRIAACLWAGDSRIYLYRDGHLYQLTRDHNLSEMFGTSGSLGGQLTRAIGSAETIVIDRVITDAQPGDVFLLCSDGITKVFDDVEIAHFLEGGGDDLAPRMVEAVAERGGTDDATAIAVFYDGP